MGLIAALYLGTPAGPEEMRRASEVVHRIHQLRADRDERSPGGANGSTVTPLGATHLSYYGQAELSLLRLAACSS